MQWSERAAPILKKHTREEPERAENAAPQQHCRRVRLYNAREQPRCAPKQGGGGYKKQAETVL
jgi:hypothetical protein